VHQDRSRRSQTEEDATIMYLWHPLFSSTTKMIQDGRLKKWGFRKFTLSFREARRSLPFSIRADKFNKSAGRENFTINCPSLNFRYAERSTDSQQ
jgi:hypothetical protein